DLVLTDEVKGVIAAVGRRDPTAALAALGPEAKELVEALKIREIIAPAGLEASPSTTAAPENGMSALTQILRSIECMQRYNATSVR
ncbi:unnamed protein product, partial [Symbiodinium pilosum]